jgi:hypothetical protein
LSACLGEPLIPKPAWLQLLCPAYTSSECPGAQPQQTLAGKGSCACPDVVP